MIISSLFTQSLCSWKVLVVFYVIYQFIRIVSVNEHFTVICIVVAITYPVLLLQTHIYLEPCQDL